MDEKTKWENICDSLEENFTIDELRRISSSLGIDHSGLSKKDICILLREDYEKYLDEDNGCGNKDSLGGEDYRFVEGKVYQYTDEKGNTWCFTEDELDKLKGINPYTLTPIPQNLLLKTFDDDTRRKVHKPYLNKQFRVDRLKGELNDLLNSMQYPPREQLDRLTPQTFHLMIKYINKTYFVRPDEPILNQEDVNVIKSYWSSNKNKGLLELIKRLPSLEAAELYITEFFLKGIFFKKREMAGPFRSNLRTIETFTMRLSPNLESFINNRRKIREVVGEIPDNFSNEIMIEIVKNLFQSFSPETDLSDLDTFEDYKIKAQEIHARNLYNYVIDPTKIKNLVGETILEIGINRNIKLQSTMLSAITFIGNMVDPKLEGLPPALDNYETIQSLFTKIHVQEDFFYNDDIIEELELLGFVNEYEDSLLDYPLVEEDSDEEERIVSDIDDIRQFLVNPYDLDAFINSVTEIEVGVGGQILFERYFPLHENVFHKWLELLMSITVINGYSRYNPEEWEHIQTENIEHYQDWSDPLGTEEERDRYHSIKAEYELQGEHERDIVDFIDALEMEESGDVDDLETELSDILARGNLGVDSLAVAVQSGIPYIVKRILYWSGYKGRWGGIFRIADAILDNEKVIMKALEIEDVDDKKSVIKLLIDWRGDNEEIMKADETISNVVNEAIELLNLDVFDILYPEGLTIEEFNRIKSNDVSYWDTHSRDIIPYITDDNEPLFSHLRIDDLENIHIYRMIDCGHIKLVKFLLDDSPQFVDESMFLHAAYNDRPEILDYLFDLEGVEVDIDWGLYITRRGQFMSRRVKEIIADVEGIDLDGEDESEEDNEEDNEEIKLTKIREIWSEGRYDDMEALLQPPRIINVEDFFQGFSQRLIFLDEDTFNIRGLFGILDPSSEDNVLVLTNAISRYAPYYYMLARRQARTNPLMIRWTDPKGTQEEREFLMDYEDSSDHERDLSGLIMRNGEDIILRGNLGPESLLTAIDMNSTLALKKILYWNGIRGEWMNLFKVPDMILDPRVLSLALQKDNKELITLLLDWRGPNGEMALINREVEEILDTKYPDDIFYNKLGMSDALVEELKEGRVTPVKEWVESGRVGDLRWGFEILLNYIRDENLDLFTMDDWILNIMITNEWMFNIMITERRNRRNDYLMKHIYRMIDCGHIQCVKYFIEKRIIENEIGMLFHAVYNDQREIFSFLIERSFPSTSVYDTNLFLQRILESNSINITEEMKNLIEGVDLY